MRARLRSCPTTAREIRARADVIKGLAGRYTSVLLASHGSVVASRDLEGAVYATEDSRKWRGSTFTFAA